MENGTFWDHLEALRWVLIRCLAVLLSVAIVAFCFKDWLFDSVVLAPLQPQFLTYRLLQALHLPIAAGHIELINIHLASQFLIHMEMAGVAALIVGFPYLSIELWLFVKPALYSHERKPAVSAIVSFVVLFFLGVATSYYVIFPLTLNFLGNYQVSAAVANQISLSSYISTLLTLSLMLGIVFEMPIVAYFFARIGVLSADLLRRYRRLAIVVIMCLAALITPSTDAFTMLLVVLPLWLLYEASIAIVAHVTAA